MKKQYILIAILAIINPVLHAISDKDMAKNNIIQKITLVYANLFGPSQYLFDKSIASVQNQNIETWYSTVKMAKDFVIDNSTNVVGVKDSYLVNAIGKIEVASMDLMNAIKISRGSIKNQGPIFSRIEKEMTQLGNDIKAKSFTLSNKKNAQAVAEAVAIYVASGANRANKDIAKASMNQ